MSKNMQQLPDISEPTAKKRESNLHAMYASVRAPLKVVIKTRMKKYIFPYIFPLITNAITRPLFAITNSLLRIRRKIIREDILFPSVICNLGTPLMYTKFSSEHFVIDTRDKVISRGIFAEGKWDFDDLNSALALLQKHNVYHGAPSLLIDVGANIGPICIPAIARNYFQRAIAIEPDPHNCRLLRANIALNGLTDKISVNESACGMFDEERLELTLSEDNFGDHQINLAMCGYVGQRRTIWVESNTLDTLCPIKSGQDALIWIDTQGFEGYVLAGARAWLDAKTPLVAEFWPSGMKRVNSFELMKGALKHYAGFYNLWGDKNQFFPIQDLDALYVTLAKEEELGEAGFTDLLVIGNS